MLRVVNCRAAGNFRTGEVNWDGAHLAGGVPAHCHVMDFTVMRTLSHSRRRAKYSASHPAKSVSGRVQFSIRFFKVSAIDLFLSPIH